MLLYLLRHGIAEDDAPTGRDEDRRLTEAGIKKTRKVLAALAGRIDPPALILTSPLARARQTAELAAEVFPKANLDDWPVLADNDAQAILNVLDELSQVPAAMLVGHNPSFSELAEALCRAEAGSINLKKAGCAALEVSYEPAGLADAPARLLWLTTPKLLV